MEQGRGATRLCGREARGAQGTGRPHNKVSAVLRLSLLYLCSQWPVNFALRRAEPSCPRGKGCVQVSVRWGCRNDLGGFNTDLYRLTVLEAGGLRSRCCRVHCVCRLPGKSSSVPTFWLLVVCWQSLTFLGSWKHHPATCLRLHMCSCCVCLFVCKFPLFIRPRGK